MHAPAMSAFLELGGQWRTAAMPNGAVLWIGLDYGAASDAFKLAGLFPGITPEIWRAMRLIEAGAMEVLNSVR